MGVEAVQTKLQALPLPATMEERGLKEVSERREQEERPFLKTVEQERERQAVAAADYHRAVWPEAVEERLRLL